jgi:maleylpyruvate isomerase
VTPPAIGVSDLPVLTRRIEWMRGGTALLAATLRSLEGTDPAAPSLLIGWTRGHVLAHIDQNAAALHNLLTWALTEIPTPMYASPNEREQGIDAGAHLPMDVLLGQVEASAAALDAAVSGLPPDRWSYPVKSALGRDIAVAEVPWLRTREVWVHCVDLSAGVGFESIPPDIARAMVDDVSVAVGAKLTGPGFSLVLTDEPGVVIALGAEPDGVVRGRTADVLAWLTGRGHPTALVHDHGDLPTLPTWI